MLLGCDCASIPIGVSPEISRLSCCRSTIQKRGAKSRDETTCGVFEASSSATDGKCGLSSADASGQTGAKGSSLRVAKDLIVEKRVCGCCGSKLKRVRFTRGPVRRYARRTTVVVCAEYLARSQSEGVAFRTGAYGRVVYSVKSDG